MDTAQTILVSRLSPAHEIVQHIPGSPSHCFFFLSLSLSHMQGTFRAFAVTRLDGSVTTWGEATFGGDSSSVSHSKVVQEPQTCRDTRPNGLRAAQRCHPEPRCHVNVSCEDPYCSICLVSVLNHTWPARTIHFPCQVVLLHIHALNCFPPAGPLEVEVSKVPCRDTSASTLTKNR